MDRLVDKIGEAVRAGRSMTSKQMSTQFGTHLVHTRKTANTLHKQRKIHIISWHRSAVTGVPSPVYAWGDALDAPVPRRIQDVIVRQAETQSFSTIKQLRESYIPGMFDPFRVLRAQVGGTA
jgi:hypothetical protein